MQRFLESCTSYIFRKYRSDFSRICIVMPNRRSGLFFTAYLKKMLKNAVIGPAVTTVNELMLSFSELLPASRLKLIADLFDIYRDEIRSTETFDDFYFWGEVLLGDFDDVDKYRVNAGALFTNLSQFKDIEHHFDYLTEEQRKILEQFWGSLRNFEKYPQERDFLTFWEKLPVIYSGFREKLASEGVGYNGMIMRDGIENVLSGKSKFAYDHYCFIGLNALNNCEKVLFRVLREGGRASFFWDYDDYYVGNHLNSAGNFMRENLLLFPPPDDFTVDTTAFSQPKNIELVAAASGVGQAQVIPSLFTEPIGKSRFDYAAIVLADESLLFPVLGAIPESFGEVNITMGYPVRNSPVVSLLMQIASLVLNARPWENKIPRLYHRLVTGILAHPLLAGIEPEKVTSLLREIKTVNKIYLTAGDLDLSPLHRTIFSPPRKVAEFSGYLLDILRQVYSRTGEDKEHLVIREMIYHIYSALEKLKSVVDEILAPEKTELSPSVYFNLMIRVLNLESVAFEGEPLSGLQVMGILETRCLDFDDLVIIGLNEDNWPKSTPAPSLIPFNLRKGFGLPGIDDQEAMYAYYFYRLIQRSRRITATWNTVREGVTGGELSRYGFQLIYHSPHQVRQRRFDYAFFSNPVKPVTVASDRTIREKMLARNRDEKALSPSAIILFMTCSLRFYFRHVVGLQEPEEVTEDIDRQLFGNTFHKAVENLYLPYTGKILTAGDFERMAADKENIRKCTLQALATEYFRMPASEWKSLSLEGKTLLIFSTIGVYLRNLLRMEMNGAPVLLRALENSYEVPVTVEIDGTPRTIRLGGKIDRVDESQGVIRVVDYKTGSLNSADLAFGDPGELFDLSVAKLRKEVIQTLTYAWILKKGYFHDSPIGAVVLAILNLNDENFRFDVRMNQAPAEISTVEKELEDNLKSIIQKIFSENSVFRQTEFTDRCLYCPYNGICRRG